MSEQLADTFGRIAKKLRISVTDRCNFRCIYCMPVNPVWMPRGDLLTFEEIRRLSAVFASLGVTSVRLTGGEPLIRRDICKLVSSLKSISSLKEVNITTNGFYLTDRINELIDAGIDRINVSLDTLRPERFEQMSRTKLLDKVLKGIECCKTNGLSKTRLNVVVIKGYNDDELLDLIDFGRKSGFETRFIEFMPLEGDNIWSSDKVVTQEEMLNIIKKQLRCKAIQSNSSSPSTTYELEDGSIFGIIPSVSNPFCRSCDRLRLTADGKFRTCLFAVEETDLKGPLRAGASDEEIKHIVKTSVFKKWDGHMINQPGFVKPVRNMYQIGG
ncbi:MAG: GTP 3',8-cyclase MoaA [Planctomycetes bacterium]|nr:GTP 3',8-cyclase MoaA [Planctomycetota bacterium]